MKHATLNVKAFGIAGGILWGAGVLFLGLWAMSTGTGAEIVTWFGQYYKGYDATLAGSIIGGIWGFFDAGIGCLIFAWLYNWLLKKV